jgi:RND family efflux transporter MFP subunit
MKKSLILVAAAVAMTAVTGCKWFKKEVVETPDNRVAIKVAVARGETIARDVEFTANIEPWQKNLIIPALQGARIDRIYVKVGDRVRKGQLVAEMDPTQYNTARIQMETAKADYERLKTVHEAGGTSARDMQTAEAQYKVFREAANNLARHVKLYSPIDGVVTNKGEEEGNLFTQTPILEIMQINRLKVKVHISEQYFTHVKVGTPVSISVDLFPGEAFEGSVSLLYPAIDPATRTFGAEITIPNGGHKLRPGMFARCVINMGSKTGVLVPDVAVQKQIGTNERYVYVIADGVAQRRLVTPGRQIGSLMDIEQGMQAGERVAVTSFSRLTDGTEVTTMDN